MGYTWGTGHHTHLITCECGRVLQITGTTTVTVLDPAAVVEPTPAVDLGDDPDGDLAGYDGR